MTGSKVFALRIKMTSVGDFKEGSRSPERTTFSLKLLSRDPSWVSLKSPTAVTLIIKPKSLNSVNLSKDTFYKGTDWVLMALFEMWPGLFWEKVLEIKKQKWFLEGLARGLTKKRNIKDTQQGTLISIPGHKLDVLSILWF